MPTYVYRASDAAESCEHCREGFEILRGMNDAALTECPECRAAIRRVYTSSFVSTKPLGDRIPDSKLKDLGFTKLAKGDDGKYRRVAGQAIPGFD